MPYRFNPLPKFLDVVESASGGNVVGPGSSTTNDIATFADTSGQVIKDSGFKTSDFLQLSGGTMTGTLELAGIPTLPDDAANKSYVDLIASGMNFKDPVVAASTGNYVVVYNNGAAGVGATLTNNDVQAAFSIDGVSPSVNDRVLIKDQTSQLENGIYEVTDVGSGVTNWVLTRTTDYDTPAEITPGTTTVVTSGTVNGSSQWMETSNITTIGVDSIQFVETVYPPSTFLLKANNLSDLNSASAARSNLGLTNIATQNTTNHNVLVGAASDGVTSVPPSATTGYPLVSAGAAADPSFTGSVNLAAGALGAPTLTWAGDSTTGFYRSGANVLDFANSGNHVFSITSSAFDVLQSLKFETQLLANSFTIPNADYLVTNNDCIIYCNKAGAMNVTLEAFPPSGKMLFIADYAGAASTNNITILGNGKTINGSASFVINVDHGAVLIQYNNSSASWNVLASFKAQVLAVTEGGTGATTASGARTNLGITNIATQTVTQYDVLVGGAANAITSIGPGLAGQVFQSAGAAANPAYSTATFPSTATGTGKILQADGTNWVASTPTYPTTSGVSGKILISDGTNFVSSTPTYPNSSVTAGKVLVSDGTNVVYSTPTFPNASAASGKFIQSDGTNWVASTPTLPTSAGATGKVLQSDGTNYVESTPTYPSASGSTGQIIRSNGTNNVYTTATYPTTTTANQILYSSSTNTISEITSGIDGVLISSHAGVPSWLANSGTAGWVLTANSGAPPSWQAAPGSGITTTQYDVLVGGAGNTIVSVGPGSAGQVLQSGGASANPAYSTATYPATATGTGTFLRADGTNWAASTSTLPNTNAQGDILYGSASNVWSSLAKDTNATRVLTNTGASNSPAWAQLNLANGVTGILTETNGGTAQSTYAQGDMLYASAANTLAKLAKNTTATRYLANTGTSNNPNWDQVNLANGVTGTLPTANGGSGQSNFAGNLVKIQTQSASNSGTIDFSNNITSTYDIYYFTVENAIAATDNQQFYIRFGTGSTPTWQATNYCFGGYQSTGDGVVHTHVVSTSDTKFPVGLGQSNVTSESGVCMTGWIFNPSSTAVYKNISYLGGCFTASNNYGQFNMSGAWQSTTAVTSLRFLFASGNITSGQFTLYGVSK